MSAGYGFARSIYRRFESVFAGHISVQFRSEEYVVCCLAQSWHGINECCSVLHFSTSIEWKYQV